MSARPTHVVHNGRTWEVRDWDPKSANVTIRLHFSDKPGDHMTKTVRKKDCTRVEEPKA